MKYGFIKVCAATPEVRVADCRFNGAEVIKNINMAYEKNTKVCVFPELCVTGYTCGDLFLQEALICAAENVVLEIAEATKGKDMLTIIGAPISFGQKLYNCAVVLYDGRIIAMIPKKNLPNYTELYEARYFAPWKNGVETILWNDAEIPFGTDIIIKDKNIRNFMLAVEICEDVWTVNPPSNKHAISGATVIANLSASSEYAGKTKIRKDLVSGQSAKLICGYIYTSAGKGESTADMVYGGDNMICENGKMLNRGKMFENDMIFAEIDVDMIAYERKKVTTFVAEKQNSYNIVEIEFEQEETMLSRNISKTPFVPETEVQEYCEEVLQIQSTGLARRLSHIGAKTAVLGISGGLDSTLALLVTARAFDIAGLDRKNIIAITMPCFGTTSRTYNNAVALTNEIGAELREINIKESVLQHFEDIGHDENVYDITFENAQARERTQVLMDVANQTGGIVIGTGDMSELALGWATYNGDHMSMYGVNSGVSKTLIKYLVGYEAQKSASVMLKKILEDILDTPVSPELLPPENGEISQKTENFVGPYVLHDFFLYYMLRFGFSPAKIYHLARYAFLNEFANEEILKWMKVFYRRFFTQQFKRSCVPDGPKVANVALSPRGDWRMPSDASANVWLDEIENLL